MIRNLRRHIWKSKYLVCIAPLITFFSMAHATGTQEQFKAKPSYEDVFTQVIYDQGPTLLRLKPRIDAGLITDQGIDEELCNALYAAKEHSLEESNLSRIRTQVRFYEKESKDAAQRLFWKGIIDKISTTAVLYVVFPPLAVAGSVEILGEVALSSWYSHPRNCNDEKRHFSSSRRDKIS